MKQLAYRTLAQEAYDAYGEVTGHTNWQGLPMPTWHDLGETIQLAWMAAVKRVCTLVDDTPPQSPWPPEHATPPGAGGGKA